MTTYAVTYRLADGTEATKNIVTYATGVDAIGHQARTTLPAGAVVVKIREVLA